jgi:hypothetical protein
VIRNLLVFVSASLALAIVAGLVMALQERWQRRRARLESAEELAQALRRFEALPPEHRAVLAGLPDVPWADLNATWIPPWLLWLQTGEADAPEDWWGSDFDLLVHQYTAWPRTAACAPFLVCIAVSSAARHRREAMDALLHLTGTWNSSPTEQVMGQVVECLRSARPLLQELRAPALEDLKTALLGGIEALASRPLQMFPP